MSPDQQPALRIDVLTLFPEVFGPFLKASMLGIAQQKGLVGYHLHNIRDYTPNKHQKVDDRPYGGGPGMVMTCEPVFNCFEAVRAMDPREGRSLLLTPQGRPFDQAAARELSECGRMTVICGRYEGFDERIRIGLPVEEVSVGDYVLTGGEPAAMCIIDAVTRLVDGVLGHEESARQDSFENGLLECPHYTRPPELRGMKVPDVLLSGHHGEINDWRSEKARERTRARRADLLDTNDAETE